MQPGSMSSIDGMWILSEVIQKLNSGRQLECESIDATSIAVSLHCVRTLRCQDIVVRQKLGYVDSVRYYGMCHICILQCAWARLELELPWVVVQG